MRAFAGHLRHLRDVLPTALVLAMVALIAGLAWGGVLPAPAAAVRATEEKESLLSYLPDVNHISYARNVIYLYAGETPVMVVWVEDDPADLYGGDGHFVAHLSFQELARVIRRASALMIDNPSWPTSHPAARDTRNQA
jgi:hypothetical protein